MTGNGMTGNGMTGNGMTETLISENQVQETDSPEIFDRVAVKAGATPFKSCLHQAICLIRLSA